MQTIEVIPQITFAIASKNNFRYVKHAVKYIRENCYRKDHIIHIGIDGEDGELEEWVKEQNQIGDINIMVSNGVSGIAAIYNDIAKKATTDFIIIYHADMIAGKDVDLYLYKQWKQGTIVSATRIEPPLHPADPAKIVDNFGLWPEEDFTDGFKKEQFNQFVENNLDNDKITKGVFAPWLIHTKDYWEVGGHDETLNSHSEDRDLFNRFLLNGFDFVQPWNAMVYHLTCRGGQFEHAISTENLQTKSESWNALAAENTKKFIRKWGTTPLYNEFQYPIIAPKYNIGLIINNASMDLVIFLEPYFTTIYTNNLGKVEGVSKLKDINDELTNDIFVTLNAEQLTNENIGFLFQLPHILKQSGEVGSMKYDIFNLYIKSLTEYQNDLIKVN
jgi:GT2 family glycosyltransferase